MFVKMKKAMVQAGTPAAISAMRYQQWMGTAVKCLHFHGHYVTAGCYVIIDAQESSSHQYAFCLYICLAKSIITCSCFRVVHSVSSINIIAGPSWYT